jgi:hypothetical protein
MPFIGLIKLLLSILSSVVACMSTPVDIEETDVGLRSYKPAAVSPINTTFPLKKSFWIAGVIDALLSRYDLSISAAENTLKGLFPR